VIVPDANLLLYAYDSASPFHARAKEWWEGLVAGNETVVLCTVVLFAFVRVGTNPRVFVSPMTIAQAAGHVHSWLAAPRVVVEDLVAEDCRRALALLEAAGAGGDLTSDAQIAALALRLRALVHTADTDFARFEGVQWRNPLS
jgi:uncharacterized protein